MGDRLADLASCLEARRPVSVQAHDYPDIDAIASAWSLAGLLRVKGFDASCFYRGLIRSRSLRGLISELGIEAAPAPDDLPDIQIVVVDGSPANGNVTLGPGELVGVIDHHREAGKASARYLDLRPELAACSTMVRGYWSGSGTELPRGFATALLAGIQSDTDFLSRRCSDEDFAAYAALYKAGDWEAASRIVRKVLDLHELGLVVSAIEGASVGSGLLFAYVDGSCGQEALAVLAEFALRAEELAAAVAASKDVDGVHVSVRTKSAQVSAFDLVRKALAGLGRGGGHEHSAGGFIPADADPGTSAIRERFFAAAAEATATR